MNKAGPIIVIEDDLDDQEILVDIFQELGYENKIIYFHDGNDRRIRGPRGGNAWQCLATNAP